MEALEIMSSMLIAFDNRNNVIWSESNGNRMVRRKGHSFHKRMYSIFSFSYLG